MSLYLTVDDIADLDVTHVEVGTVCYCIKSKQYYSVIALDQSVTIFNRAVRRGLVKLDHVHNNSCKVCGVTYNTDPDMDLKPIEINPKNSISKEIQHKIDFHHTPPRKEFVYICKKCKNHILQQWKDEPWHS